jgi:hypothetical protein
MKKLYFTLLAFALLIANGNAQTTLFTENFNTGSTTQFTLNTTDLSSAGANAINQWVINNSYIGTKDSGMFYCPALSFTFPYVVTSETTPGEPASVAGYPNSNYLHINDTLARHIGIHNADFTNADGQCIFAQNSFVKMNAGVNTTGLYGVSFSFWWVCVGASVAYGQVYYSVDGGTTWILITSPITKYNSTSSWTQQVISLPAFNNVADLRFGFMWVNNVYSSGTDLDPAFSIDDVNITNTPNGINQVLALNTRIFPNPTTGDISIQSAETVKQITVTNTLGQVVSTMEVNSGAGKNITVHLPPASGLYFLRITGNDTDYVTKVVKE